MTKRQSDIDEVRWAPRVPPEKIRRLYASDARGMLDEELLDDVLISLLVRCESMQTIAQAIQGHIVCPRCGSRFDVNMRGGHLILFEESGPRRLEVIGEHLQKEDTIRCPGCAWSVTWAEYRATWDRKKLNMGGAGLAIDAFVRKASRPLPPREKMQAIDDLIHSFHLDLEMKPVRPTACNVVDANLQQVVELIETLAYGDATTAPKTRKWQEGWWSRPHRKD
jgi:DNA-directed RNA polymerase subunit RPC12/RpoP